jgi:hypothetical protein
LCGIIPVNCCVKTTENGVNNVYWFGYVAHEIFEIAHVGDIGKKSFGLDVVYSKQLPWSICGELFLAERFIVLFYAPSNIFYTDDSLSNGVTGLTVQNTPENSVRFQWVGPCTVFTAQISAMHMTLLRTHQIILVLNQH